jgi:hypothetical protein
MHQMAREVHEKESEECLKYHITRNTASPGNSHDGGVSISNLLLSNTSLPFRHLGRTWASRSLRSTNRQRRYATLSHREAYSETSHFKSMVQAFADEQLLVKAPVEYTVKVLVDSRLEGRELN